MEPRGIGPGPGEGSRGPSGGRPTATASLVLTSRPRPRRRHHRAARRAPPPGGRPTAASGRGGGAPPRRTARAAPSRRRWRRAGRVIGDVARTSDRSSYGAVSWTIWAWKPETRVSSKTKVATPLYALLSSGFRTTNGSEARDMPPSPGSDHTRPGGRARRPATRAGLSKRVASEPGQALLTWAAGGAIVVPRGGPGRGVRWRSAF